MSKYKIRGSGKNKILNVPNQLNKVSIKKPVVSEGEKEYFRVMVENIEEMCNTGGIGSVEPNNHVKSMVRMVSTIDLDLDTKERYGK